MQEFDYDVTYIKGKSNVAADALSRQYKEVHRKSTDCIKKLMAVTAVRIADQVLQNFEEEYNNDEDFKEIFSNPKEPYKKDGKRLYFEHRMCIPQGSTRKTILHDNHESLLGAHRGFNKTLRKIEEHFFWPSMRK